MYPDVSFLIKKMNLQAVDVEDGNNFQRSYAFRRKKRPVFVQNFNQKRKKSARENFNRCIDRCGILDGGNPKDYSEDKNNKKYMKMKKKKIKNMFIDSLTKTQEAPWFVKWKRRKIRPFKRSIVNKAGDLLQLDLIGSNLITIQNFFINCHLSLWRYFLATLIFALRNDFIFPKPVNLLISPFWIQYLKGTPHSDLAIECGVLLAEL
ncbi:hypothetical protein WA026_010238 [Henosepilachna vigintioctopunctata]|uniref:Uncharacterized protein n=1 Tax=Henosepilachna vigintioctopunctata TaxID=420089 RepID=A0AAW1UIM5_9CUCU